MINCLLTLLLSKLNIKILETKNFRHTWKRVFEYTSIMKEWQCHRCGCSDKVYHLHYIECVSFLHEYIPTAHESMVSTL